MSGTFTRRAKTLTFGGLATLGLAVVAQLAVTPGAFSAQDPVVVPSPYSVGLNPGNIGATATSEGCAQDDMNNVPSDKDGFLFVASPDNFVTFQAIFDTGTVTVASQSDTSATQFFSKDFDHLVIVAPAGATLLNAFATLSGDKTFFTLSHTCAASVEETPSPTPSETVSETPSATPSETVSETPSATPSETVSETPSSTPSETVSETPSSTPSETVSETPSETPTAEVSATETETATPSPTESAEVLPTVITSSPTPSASVEGVKVVRPVVAPTRLPSTGTPFPIMALVLLGVGLLAAGVVTTVAGETRTTGTTPRHRR